MYYAISSIGWGTGDTPEEAVDNYFDVQASNRPSYYNEKDWMAGVSQWAQPVVHYAPEGAHEFALDLQGRVRWFDSDGNRIPNEKKV